MEINKIPKMNCKNKVENKRLKKRDITSPIVSIIVNKTIIATMFG